MRLKRAGTTFLTTACALVLSVLLAACGGDAGGSVADALSEATGAVIGSWEMYEGTTDGAEVSHEDYEALNELGLHVTLDLDEDGNALLDMYGMQQEGSWQLKDERTVELTFEEETDEATLEDGRLTFAGDGATLTFEKTSDTPVMDRDPQDNAGGSTEPALPDKTEGEDVGEGDAAELDEDMAELADPTNNAYQDVYLDSIDEVTPLGIVVADDETARIEVTAIGCDYEGDTGYLLSIENKTDAPFVLLTDEVLLDGEDLSQEGFTIRYVEAGATKKAFVWFQAESGANPSVSEGSACTAIIYLIDTSYNTLGLYTMSIN